MFIQHIYLTINNFETQIHWFEDLFSILGFTKSYTYDGGGFVAFTSNPEKDLEKETSGINPFTIGIVSSSAEHAGQTYHRFKVGFSHLAIQYPSRAKITEIAGQIVEKLNPPNLKLFGDNLKVHSHHGVDHFTFTFYTPDGIMIELIAD